MSEIKSIKGAKPGPISLILGGVHGDETCGIEAIKALSKMSIEAGEVMYGLGNPKAIEQKTRFTEANLNRMFKSLGEITEAEKRTYEFQRAQELKPYLDKAEVLLDIHASYTPVSEPFIICEPIAFKVAAQLPVSKLVAGFGSIEKGGTDGYMVEAGKIGICVECGYKKDPASHQMAQAAVKAFLIARGHISGQTRSQKQRYFRMEQIRITKHNFKLAKQFVDFEVLSKGTLIGLDGTERVVALKDNTVLLFARNRQHSGEEACVTGVENPEFV